MGKYKIDVPVKKNNDSESSSSETSKKETEKNSLAMKSLTKVIAVGNVIASVTTSALSGVAQLFTPLIRILSALFIVIFLPLLPLLMDLTNALADFVEKVAASGGGIKGLSGTIGEDSGNMGKILKGAGLIILGVIAVIALFFVSGFLAMGALIIAAFVLLATGITIFWEGFKGVLDRIWEGMKNTWEQLGEAFENILQWFKDTGLWILGIGASIWGWFIESFKDVLNWGSDIWDYFIEGLKSVANFGDWIWNLFKDGLSSLSNLGSKIWSLIKSAARGIVTSSDDSIEDGVIQNGRVISVSPADTIMAFKDPKIFNSSKGVSGSLTINVNNPVIREDADIRKLTDMISRRLQAKGNRGFSSR